MLSGVVECAVLQENARKCAMMGGRLKNEPTAIVMHCGKNPCVNLRQRIPGNRGLRRFSVVVEQHFLSAEVNCPSLATI